MGILARIGSFSARLLRRLAGLAVAAPLALGAASPDAQARALARFPGAEAQAHAAIAAAREPSARSTVTWMPSTLRLAEQLADSGDLRLVGELCEWLFGDERFGTVVSTRVRALLGSDVSFDKGRGRKARAAVRAVEAEEDWWRLMPESEQASALAWGLVCGVALVYEDHSARPELGAREVPTFRVWSSRWLRYDLRTGKVYVRIATDGGGYQEIEATRENGFRLFCPYGSSMPWKKGVWRGCGRFGVMKALALGDLAHCSEIHGCPVFVITPSAFPAQHDVRSDLANEVAALGRSGVVALPSGYTLELAEAKAKTWEMFVAQIKLANDGFAIALLGGNLTTEAGDGAATGATAQTLVRLDLRRFDAQVWSTWMHDEVLASWAVWNFGDAQAAPWPVFDIEPPADVRSAAEAMRALGEAGMALDKWLATHGQKSDAVAICEEYGVPIEELAQEAPAPTKPTPSGPANDGSSDGQLAAVIPIEAARWRGLGKRRRAGRAA